MTLDDIFKQNTLALGQGGAPSYDLNTLAGQGLLGMTLGAGNAGRMDNGISAFLGPLYHPVTEAGGVNPNMDTSLFNNKDYSASKYMLDLGQQLGYGGLSGADMDYLTKATPQEWNTGMNGYTGYQDTTSPVYAQNKMEATQKYEAGLNDYLKDYSKITGLSSGWDGSQGNARSAASTLYHNDGNNVWNPVSTPQGFTAREKGNWFQENPEFVSALSVMLPAFGGWAGLAGQAAGTASMGSGTTGLGALGTAAANTAGATAMGAATGGTGGALRGLAGGVGGYLGGMAGNAAGGYGGLGSQIGSQAGKSLASLYNPGQVGPNPGSMPTYSLPSGNWQQSGVNQFTDTTPLNRF